MWEALDYLIFAIVECVALFYLMFTLFRFRFKDHYMVILITSILVSGVSFFFRDHNFSSYVPFVTIAIYIILIRSILKIGIFYSFAMVIVSYIIYAVIQTTVFVALNLTGLVDRSELTEKGGHILQIISIICTIIISRLLTRYRLWFTFVPVSSFKIKLNNSNLLMIIVGIISLISVAVVLKVSEVLSGMFVFLVCAMFLLYISIKKERNDL